jgi:hypothetical protein
MESVAPPTAKEPVAVSSNAKSIAGGFMIAGTVIGAIITFLFHYGAARLSYLKYQSIGWAIVNFFFAVFYYPFYALVLAEPVAAPSAMYGGAKALKGLMKMFR